MYNAQGEKVWECTLDIYGKVRTLQGSLKDCPFRYQGQYDDVEIGLYYNRFRYYSPDTGTYISQDPIRLISGEANFYAYVRDSNFWVDSWGLLELYHGTTKAGAEAIRKNGIDLSQNRPNLDFNSSGSGAFYTSESLKETVKYNKRLEKRYGQGSTDIVKFDIPDEKLADLKIKVFEGPTEEWADFVTKGRNGTLAHNYDMVIGPKLANPDKVITRLEPPRALSEMQVTLNSKKAAQLASQHINH